MFVCLEHNTVWKAVLNILDINIYFKYMILTTYL